MSRAEDPAVQRPDIAASEFDALDDFLALCRHLPRTRSANDGEALLAMRAANAILARNGISWDAVLVLLARRWTPSNRRADLLAALFRGDAVEPAAASQDGS